MRILLTGATGFVGQAVYAELRRREHVVGRVGRSATGTDGLAVDLCRNGAMVRLVDEGRPDGVIHLAAVSDIGPARDDPERARRLNTEIPGELSGACARHGVRLVAVSTDQVFDGSRGGWQEDDKPAPIHLYGETKRDGELAVLAAYTDAVVVRPALVTGRAPAGCRSASTALFDALDRGDTPNMFTDEVRSPVAVGDLARALVDLVVHPVASGLFHCGGPEALTRHELARREVAAAGLDPDRVGVGTRAASGLLDSRPGDLSLDSRRLVDVLGWTPATLGPGSPDQR